MPRSARPTSSPSGAVTLRRWCRVEGRVVAVTKPVAGQKVQVYRVGSPGGDSARTSWEDEAVTGADGRFACDRVIQGRLVVDRLFSGGAVEGVVHCLASVIEVREGRTTRVNVGGPGRALVGRFEAPKDLGLPIDWSKVRVHLGLKAPHIGFPGDEPIWETYRAFLKTEEGSAYLRDNLAVKGDGSFRIEAVPPGTHDLTIWSPDHAVGRPPSEPDVYYASGQATPSRSTPTVDDAAAINHKLGDRSNCGFRAPQIVVVILGHPKEQPMATVTIELSRDDAVIIATLHRSPGQGIGPGNPCSCAGDDMVYARSNLSREGRAILGRESNCLHRHPREGNPDTHKFVANPGVPWKPGKLWYTLGV